MNAKCIKAEPLAQCGIGAKNPTHLKWLVRKRGINPLLDGDTMTAIMIPAWIDGEMQPVEKLDAHVRGLRHKAVSVFLMAGGSLLIQRRALGKYHTPGLWANTCCTHPEWNEPDADCAVRRLAEELGITNVHVEHRGQVEYRADVGNGLTEHEVVEIFVVETDADVMIRQNPDEVMEIRWITLDDLHAEIAATPEIFTPWLRIYMAKYSKLIFGSDT